MKDIGNFRVAILTLYIARQRMRITLFVSNGCRLLAWKCLVFDLSLSNSCRLLARKCLVFDLSKAIINQ
uniref:Uncharacterized protein n=1 Tax=Amphimedon queenslandica TaxID=400682 RepID=A0A1X7UJU3_AMPQE